MRINNNMSAVITNNQLLGTEQSLSDVMEKLSSGFNINHASDNPSGIAIAGKMQAQIDGLGQASTNSEDGISVLQTAEGALGEVTDMIQRMRELSVQAANGTNSDEERETIQMEIDSLLEEVDRISDTTQFNTINLLDGSLDNRTYAEHCSRVQTSNTVAEGTYVVKIAQAATQATLDSASTGGTFSQDGGKTQYEFTIGDANTTDFKSLIDNTTWTNTISTVDDDGKAVVKTETGTGLGLNGTISINGYEITLTQGSSGESVYEQIRAACEKGSATISDPDQALTITSMGFGASAYMNITFSSTEFAAALGIDVGGDSEVSKTGTDAVVDVIDKNESITIGGADYVDPLTGDVVVSEFGTQATATMDGNHITITDVDGFELQFKVDDGYDATTVNADGTSDEGYIFFNVTDIGSMTLHIGANKDQNMDIRISNTDTESMYIDDLDVTKMDGPENALDKLDYALNYITQIRSQLGAYENRLDHTKSSLDETEENMTSAISRIEDADMATTMVEYTKLNVLEQAGTSALSQANELPQLALQLLQ